MNYSTKKPTSGIIPERAPERLSLPWSPTLAAIGWGFVLVNNPDFALAFSLGAIIRARAEGHKGAGMSAFIAIAFLMTFIIVQHLNK